MSERTRWIYELAWPEVDPGQWAYDPAVIRADVGEIVERAHESGDWRGRFITAVSSELVERRGAWLVGWCFSIGEGSSGGVVNAWCCEPHSLPKHPASPEQRAALANQIALAIEQWRRHLESLAKDFSQVDLSGDEACAQLALEEAIGRLIARVVEATAAEDAWYAYAETAVVWLLESLGCPRSEALGAAWQALAGRFESWCGPSDEKRTEAAHAVTTLGWRHLSRS
jgi:hypothetical protein